jgi:transaldolase
MESFEIQAKMNPVSRPSSVKSKMQMTCELGTDFWNDSCALNELKEAVDNGAVGATSNPVIVLNAVKNDPQTWSPVIDQLIKDSLSATEDEIAWMLIEELGRRASKLLLPIFEETQGKKGFLSMQVNPKYYRDADRMFEHGMRLASLGPNIAIKAPCTDAGIIAMERLVSEGLNINATVSFSVSQAVSMAEAIERGLEQALRSGKGGPRLHPYVTIMVGRVDDHIQKIMAKENVIINPGVVSWAGVAVFKKAFQIFRSRGYRSSLLAAAYRHHLHWSELIGPGNIQTIPYSWWKAFNASDLQPQVTIEKPVEPAILSQLYGKFSEFRKAYDEGAMSASEFGRYGATVNTVNQFLVGYQDLLGLVRERMFK